MAANRDAPGGVGANGNIVRAFGIALRRADTYRPDRNLHVVFGFAWGVPVPLATLAVDCLARGWPLTPGSMLGALAANPWQWWFVVHPLLFAVVFGAIGTMVHDREAQVELLLEQLRKRADTDGLTGLLNHRAFQARLREETTRAVRQSIPISLLFLDIDHFKRLNDEHGHQAGDRALQGLGRRLRGLVRPYDVVARYGGEEFAIIAPGIDGAEAAVAAERVRAGVADRPFQTGPGDPVPMTVSIGVATLRAEESVADWLRRADERLYTAKRDGRDRVAAAAADPVA